MVLLDFGGVFRPTGRWFGSDLVIGGFSIEKRAKERKFTSFGGRKALRCSGGWRRPAPSATDFSSPARVLAARVWGRVWVRLFIIFPF